MKKKILVLAQLPLAGLTALKENFEVLYPENSFYFSDAEVQEHLAVADGVLSVFTKPFKADLLKLAPNVKIVSNYGVGYNNIDVEYATSNGIAVCNTPGAVTEPTAEMAMGLMIALMRRICETDRKLRNPAGLKWGMMENLGSSLWGKTLGIVGMGRIGRAITRRAVASGMKVIYYNRTKPAEGKEEADAKWVPFDTLLELSDIVSLSCPLTDETFHLIGDAQMQRMKTGAYLINTARGPVVDEQALVKNLLNGKLGGAGLDVFEDEPRITPELFAIDNVVLTPHTATGTIDSRIMMAEEASESIIRFFNGRKDIPIVNSSIWG